MDFPELPKLCLRYPRYDLKAKDLLKINMTYKSVAF